MARNSLIDFFEDFATSDRPFLVHDDGYRVREVSYRELADAARAFASRLTSAGFRADDKVVIWSENRPEWLAALWGCLLARVVLVPVDYRASPDLVVRISRIVQAKAVLVGAEVQAPAARDGRRLAIAGSFTIGRASTALGTGTRRWIEPRHPGTPEPRNPQRRHPRRNHLHVRRDGRTERRDDHASERPREHHSDRTRDREVPPVPAAVPADPLSEPAAAEPHVRAVDGDVRAADADGHGGVLSRLQSDRNPAADSLAADFRAGLRPEGARCPERTHRARRRRSRPRRMCSRASISCGAGGAIARCIACSAGSSGASSAARHRSSRSSKRSGESSASWSCRATG